MENPISTSLGSPPISKPSLDRLTAVVNLYHEHAGEPTVQAEARFARALTTFQEPFFRRVVVKEDWTLMDVGWVTKVGYILIENRMGVGLTVNPSEVERERINRGILLVRLGEGPLYWLVQPGCFLVAQPPALVKVYLMSQCGEIPVNLRVFPA